MSPKSPKYIKARKGIYTSTEDNTNHSTAIKGKQAEIYTKIHTIQKG